jgi:hypothetical protein
MEKDSRVVRAEHAMAMWERVMVTVKTVKKPPLGNIH